MQYFHDKRRYRIPDMSLDFPFAEPMGQRKTLETGQFPVVVRSLPAIVPWIVLGNDCMP